MRRDWLRFYLTLNSFNQSEENKMATVVEKDLKSNKGQREYLTDLIAVVDAKSTPFTSMAKKSAEIGNTLMRWQADGYASAVTTGTVDGTDVDVAKASTDTENPTTQRVELENYIQVHRRSLRIGFIADNKVHNVAGIKSEVARGVSKKLVELKRDMEATYMSANEMQLDNGTVPYLTRGLGNWIQNSAQSVNPVDAAYRTASGAVKTYTSGALTEANVQDVLTAIFNETGQIQTFDLIAGTTLKRDFTGLTEPVSSGGTNTLNVIQTFNKDGDAQTFKSNIKVFEGDFGTIRIHPSTFMPAATTGYLLPMNKCEIRFAQYATVKELTDNGGGPARMVQAIAALCVHNPLGFGKFVV